MMAYFQCTDSVLPKTIGVSIISTIWSCIAYITAIPQQLSFEPGYVLQVGLTSPLRRLLFLFPFI